MNTTVLPVSGVSSRSETPVQGERLNACLQETTDHLHISGFPEEHRDTLSDFRPNSVNLLQLARSFLGERFKVTKLCHKQACYMLAHQRYAHAV